MPIPHRGLSENLCRCFGPYKVVHRVSELGWEAVPDGTMTRQQRSVHFELVCVVHIKPYQS